MSKLMHGTYYEFVGGMSDDVLISLSKSDMTDREAKQRAADEERCVYKNTYENGNRIASIKIYDPYDDEYFSVGKDTVYYEPVSKDKAFTYSMLGRLQSDCEYFLGNGYGYEPHLWAGSVEKQIAEMRKRWNEFTEDEKPEWLTMEQIDEYEKKMLIAKADRDARIAEVRENGGGVVYA